MREKDEYWRDTKLPEIRRRQMEDKKNVYERMVRWKRNIRARLDNENKDEYWRKARLPEIRRTQM